jgi:secondary thiamine-phosphate synthase enzyme
MTSHGDLRLRTGARIESVPITERVQALLDESGMRDGICLVSSMHTTAGIFVNENADPDVCADLELLLASLAPERGNYAHAEGNSDAHAKAVLCGNSVALPVRSGRLALGTWQGIFFAEFDGPRSRTVMVDFLGE